MSNLRFHVERCEEKAVSGWGFDPENPLSRLQVEVKSAGHVIGTGVASIMRPDLARVGFGDGKCGFEIPLNGGKGGDPVTITLENPRNAKRAALEDKLTRPEGLVTFPADHARRLSAKGLTLTNARGSLIFARGSYFEPPIVVHSILQNGFIQIGSFTGVYGGDLGSATIGRYCSIAPNVSIGPNEHPTDWLTSSVVAENATRHDWDLFARPGKRESLLSHRNGYTANLRRTTIGHDVWIGTRTLIRKGVTIGDGAIVAGGSVVTQDVPPYAIVAGVPARVKRLRFDERTIERLLALRWWRFAIYDFIDLPLSNIERTLDLLEERLASSSVSEWQPERITPAILQDMIDKL